MLDCSFRSFLSPRLRLTARFCFIIIAPGMRMRLVGCGVAARAVVRVVGPTVGLYVGLPVGLPVGVRVGVSVGRLVGPNVGPLDNFGLIGVQVATTGARDVADVDWMLPATISEAATVGAVVCLRRMGMRLRRRPVRRCTTLACSGGTRSIMDSASNKEGVVLLMLLSSSSSSSSSSSLSSLSLSSLLLLLSISTPSSFA